MNIILIGLEFSNSYVGETFIKPIIYAIKLKLEFVILNQLISLIKVDFTEENRFQSGQGQQGNHELRNCTLTSQTTADSEATALRKVGNWISVKDVRDSFSGGHINVARPDKIFKTHQVEVVNKPKIINDSTTSSSTAVTAGETGLPPKVKSLISTPIIYMSNRPSRLSRADPNGRDHSPSESEEELRRKSTDSEKEGTRWIDGDVSTVHGE